MIEHTNTALFTLGAWIVAHAVPVAGFVAICMQVIWLYYKVRREKLEIKKLNSQPDKDDDKSI